MRGRHKRFIDEAMRKIAAQGEVLDVGGGEPFGKWMEEYRPLFKDCSYRTCDYDASTGADVIGDIHNLPVPDESVKAIICSSVLEHVRDPLQAMREMHRILVPGGRMFLYIPSTYPYHARPGHYPDYWRFFKDTLEELATGFTELHIEKRGGYFTALSFFVPMQHKMQWFLAPLAEALDTLFKTERRNTTAGYFAYLVK